MEAIVLGERQEEMTSPTFSTATLRQLVAHELKNHPSLRRGQAHWNVANGLWPQLTDSLHGTNVDPFYDDGRIGEFVIALYEKASNVET